MIKGKSCIWHGYEKFVASEVKRDVNVLSLFLQVQRKQVDFHLQSAVKLHLDLTCVKLNNTAAKLNNTEVKLNDTEVKLNDTQKKLETTTNLEEEFNTRMFIWKINNFSDIFIFTESAPFYTGRSESYGYKLKVQIYPNGIQLGTNTHLSLFIFLMKGEYDAILPLPFKKKVKFTLIDQQEDSVERENITGQFIPDNSLECFERPTQKESSTGYGPVQFISHEKLHSRPYLVDDTLFLQVEVGPWSS